MKTTGVRKPSELEIKTCPFCFHKLDAVEYIKRKAIKTCVCSKCKNKIDERHIVW